MDDNGFLWCQGAPDSGVNPHRAHLEEFSLQGTSWTERPRYGNPGGAPVWFGRPGSYCRSCHKLRYWPGVQSVDDVNYDTATATELQQWMNAGDKEARQLYTAWLDDLKNGRPNDRLIGD